MQNDLRRGALFAVSAAAAFSVTGACVKAASINAPTEVVVFFRSAISLLVLLPWILRQGVSSLRSERVGGHLWRAAFGVSAMYAFFYAIGHMHLAEAMLLTYSTPLFIPFIAWYWIGEKPPAVVYPAALTGLVGIAFIVKPGSEEINWFAGMVGVCSGILAACAMVSIRRISDTEPAPRIVFYFVAMATVISSIPMLWAWQTPDATTLLQLIGAGLTATVGQLCLTRAYAMAPAARVGPFTYAAVIFSALIAWMIWDERMDAWSVLGSLLVIATCVMVGWKRPEPRLEE
ncbi:DMT family transporter [Stenotrophobium rhamnosiphilum]|uniref:EamA family transporter n=1 Tax=Stenotrophobium rhamnosiphilum TaxID=2029166 RepID=A0A2T5MHG0_9GAMM|nr:DMT family transporter [Stenotrophobium rhamnosiphilum]PTU32010.1 EamA family transporter [Stenotrophobium rhamnosiphilum]